MHHRRGSVEVTLASFAWSATVAAALMGSAFAQTRTLRPEQTIWSSNNATIPQLGTAVASDGEWVVAAAPTDDTGTALNTGSVFIYRRVDGELQFVAKRSPSNLQSAVSVERVDVRDGIVAVASSRADPSLQPHLRGQCSIYDLTDPAIPMIGRILANEKNLGTLSGGTLGQRVAVLDRDHVAITVREYGVIRTSSGAAVPSGAVFVYERRSNGWAVDQIVSPGRDFFPSLSPPLTSIDNRDARGMDFDGERLVIGATYSFSVYEWKGDRLKGVAFVQGHPAGYPTQFGVSVAIHGDTVAVGDWGYILNEPFAARVHVYRETAGVWQREATLSPSDDFIINPTGFFVNPGFGQALDLDGRGRLLVGAPSGQRTNTASPPGTELPGTAYLFEHGPSGWEETLRLWEAFDEHQSEHGDAVAFAGDMAVVGARLADPPGSISGVGSVNTFLLPLGDVVCGGEPNSTGGAGELDVVGDRDVEFRSLEVRARSLPAGASAMLLASRDASFVPNPGSSAGNLCLGGQIARFVGSIGAADASGEIAFDVPDLTIPTPGGPETIEAGDSWTFQVWHRDNDPAPTSNFTAAYRVEFL